MAISSFYKKLNSKGFKSTDEIQQELNKCCDELLLISHNYENSRIGIMAKFFKKYISTVYKLNPQMLNKLCKDSKAVLTSEERANATIASFDAFFEQKKSRIEELGLGRVESYVTAYHLQAMCGFTIMELSLIDMADGEHGDHLNKVKNEINLILSDIEQFKAKGKVE